MKILNRLWEYFFGKKTDPPTGYVSTERMEEWGTSEVKFFDPVTLEEQFKTSKTLKDFLKKIDK